MKKIWLKAVVAAALGIALGMLHGGAFADGVPVKDLQKFNTKAYGGESAPDLTKMKEKPKVGGAKLDDKTGIPKASTFKDTLQGWTD